MSALKVKEEIWTPVRIEFHGTGGERGVSRLE